MDVGGGGLLRRFAGRFVHGGLAGVEHEYGHAAVVEELAQFAAGDGPHVLLAAGMLEEQVAVFAVGLAAQREGVDGFQPIGQSRAAQIRVAAVAVEMDDVVGPSGGLCVGEFVLELLERGRAEGGDVETAKVRPRSCKRRLATARSSTSLRPPGRQTTYSSRRRPSAAGGTCTKLRVGFDWTRTKD